MDARGMDARGIDPRSIDPRSIDPRSLDPRSLDPRVMDPRLMDLRMMDPRMVDPRLGPQAYFQQLFETFMQKAAVMHRGTSRSPRKQSHSPGKNRRRITPSHPSDSRKRKHSATADIGKHGSTKTGVEHSMDRKNSKGSTDNKKRDAGGRPREDGRRAYKDEVDQVSRGEEVHCRSREDGNRSNKEVGHRSNREDDGGRSARDDVGRPKRDDVVRTIRDNGGKLHKEDGERVKDVVIRKTNEKKIERDVKRDGKPSQAVSGTSSHNAASHDTHAASHDTPAASHDTHARSRTTDAVVRQSSRGSDGSSKKEATSAAAHGVQNKQPEQSPATRGSLDNDDKTVKSILDVKEPKEIQEKLSRADVGGKESKGVWEKSSKISESLGAADIHSKSMEIVVGKSHAQSLSDNKKSAKPKIEKENTQDKAVSYVENFKPSKATITINLKPPKSSEATVIEKTATKAKKQADEQAKVPRTKSKTKISTNKSGSNVLAREKETSGKVGALGEISSKGSVEESSGKESVPKVGVVDREVLVEKRVLSESLVDSSEQDMPTSSTDVQQHKSASIKDENRMAEQTPREQSVRDKDVLVANMPEISKWERDYDPSEDSYAAKVLGGGVKGKDKQQQSASETRKLSLPK